MGTLIRTAAAFNCLPIIIVDGVNPFNQKVIQASAGNLNQNQLICCNYSEFKKQAKNKNTISMIVKNGIEPKKINFKNSILCIGNEINGLPKDFILESKQKMTLPMPGETESLSAATAGSIGIYCSKN